MGRRRGDGVMQKLIDAVVNQIRSDVNSGDLTAVEELIRTLDYDRLLNFLPEDQWINHPKDDHGQI